MGVVLNKESYGFRKTINMPDSKLQTFCDENGLVLKEWVGDATERGERVFRYMIRIEDRNKKPLAEQSVDVDDFHILGIHRVLEEGRKIMEETHFDKIKWDIGNIQNSYKMENQKSEELNPHRNVLVTWSPKEDITAFELSKCIKPLLYSEGNHGMIHYSLLENDINVIGRHFEIKEL